MMRRILHFQRCCRRDERGNASIEFAFIGIMLVVLTLGVFELGRYTHTSHRLAFATGVVSRLVGMGATNEQITASIRERLLPNLRDVLTVTITEPTIENLDYVEVVAQIDLPLLIPNLGLFGQRRDTMVVRSIHRVPAAPET